MTTTIPDLSSPLSIKVIYGAKDLDERVPDWYKRVNLAELDLGNDYDCILGQLFESYLRGLIAMGWSDEDAILRGLYVRWADDLDEDAYESAYYDLTDFWCQEINARLAYDEEK